MKLKIIKSAKRGKREKKIFLEYKDKVTIFDPEDAFILSFKLKAIALEILGKRSDEK